MNDEDKNILTQMLVYCDAIAERIAAFEIDEDSFAQNSAYFDMLLMPLFQIGEISKTLSEAYILQKPQIPWHAIRGFRNVIAHDYGVVNPSWVWNTIQCDIPALRIFLEDELS